MAVAILAGSGCYQYVDIPVESVAPGDKIRVTMTRDEVFRQGDLLTTLDERLDGTVLESDAAQGLTMTYPAPHSAPSGPDFNRVLTVSWDGLVGVEGPVFSWPRTIAVAAVGTAVVVAILGLVVGGSEGESGELPPIDADVYMPPPLFRIPLPF